MTETKYDETGYDLSSNTAQPQDHFIPKLSQPTPESKKTRAITFRAKKEFYESLRVAAKENRITLSAFISTAIEDYWDIQTEIYKKARYLNACDEKTQVEILQHERQYPPSCRQFTIARQTYPDAGQMSADEMKTINEFLEEERKNEAEAAK